MSEVLKTPISQFSHLPGYNFKENFVSISNLSMHYVDEGSGPVVLLLHGEPSWSYLYRKMIPIIVKNGYRCIAPDLIGFGKSDKPTDPTIYTYKNHSDWLLEFITQLELKEIHLFCQDWGGLLGLRIAGLNPDLFSSITSGNTFLPTGDIPPKDAFLEWKHFSQNVKRLPIGKIIQSGCVNKLSPEELQAYNAPYPSEEYKTAARIFPTLVPITPDDPASEINRTAWIGLQNWEKPFLCLFSDSDPVTKGADVFFRRKVPGAKGQPHKTIEKAGHFLQEDKGEEIADYLCHWLKTLPK